MYNKTNIMDADSENIEIEYKLNEDSNNVFNEIKTH